MDLLRGKGAIAGAATASVFWISILIVMICHKRDTEGTIKEGDESSSEEEDGDSNHNESKKLPDCSKDWGISHAPFKMLLCVNQELYDGTGKSVKMKPGKVAAQCCHAVLGLYKRALRRCPGAVKAWEYTGQAKIAVKCPTESELQALKSDATARGLCSYLVHDAGRTQIAPNSKTVLALGPAPVAVFDDFTAHLKLY